MLKLKKKNVGNQGPDTNRGITSEGNSLRRQWLITTVYILVSLVGCFGYLLLRETGIQDERIARAASAYSAQQAAGIEQLLRQYKTRMEAAAASPLLVAALSSDSSGDLVLVEKAMLDYFPELVSLRIIEVGEISNAGLEGSNLGLRNHIEVDLLRRAKDGEQPAAESYQFEGTWLTTLAILVEGKEAEHRAVVLGTFDNQVLASAIAASSADLGQFSLEQIYRKGNFTRSDAIASAGSAAAGNIGEEYRSEVPLNEGLWLLKFTPSSKMLNTFGISNLPLLLTLALMLLTALAAMGLFLWFFQKSLEAEVNRIIAAADRRSALLVSLPALLPLAKQLRNVTLRLSGPGEPGEHRRRSTGTEPGEAPAGAALVEETPAEEPAEEPEETADPAADSHPGFPRHIFRAYDIRGIVEEELDPELVIRIGRALGTLAGERDQQALVVGCDGRTSSPTIKNALAKALLDSGRDVIDIGTIPTPALSFATHTLSTRSGVMVTASHNPPEYNGFKITLDGMPLAGEELQQLVERIHAGKFSQGAGRLAKQDIRKSYAEAVISDIAITNALKIVVDAGNGAAGELAPMVLEGMGCDVIRLHCDIDGTFPNHHPDPSVDANLKDLQQMVVETGADFGIAFDGDGDRLCVVTGNGQIVRNDMLMMLFAQDVVSRNPGADVVFDIQCSRQLTQIVSRFGGRPILWKTGHALMREKIRETGALLGGEFSGHIYFGERWFGFDDAIYAAARLAEIISGTGETLEQLISDYPVMENTPEIRIPLNEEAKFPLIALIAEKGDFSPGKVTTLDGVRVDYNDCWGLVRASNTGPNLVARFEGRDADALGRIQRQFREQISQLAPDLDLPF